MANKNLNAAKEAKKDEFYTQLADIENELKHYRQHFRGKKILCNCDDPYESNFFKYFANNFNAFGLKKLTATCYNGSPIAGGELPLLFEATEDEPKKIAYKVEITEVTDVNGDGRIDLADVRYLIQNDKNVLSVLKENGDFRSKECVELLKEADIVVTNPPFSLFREYVAQLMEFEKKFLIIGNQNNVTYKEVFPLIKDNKIWLGVNSGSQKFEVPLDFQRNNTFIDKNGKKYAKFGNICWFTNLDNKNRHEELILFKKYSPEEYPKYDNFDAINIAATTDIPIDYSGLMGVPITFLDKYNPEQFVIIGITKTWFGMANKIYPEQIQIDKNGKQTKVTKLNDGAVLEVSKPPINKTYYKIGEKIYIQKYPRILIKKK